MPYGYHYLALFVAAAVGTSLTPARSRARDVSGVAVLLAFSYLPVYLNFIDWMPGMRYHVPLVGLLLVPIGHIAAADPRERRATELRVAAVASAVALASPATLPPMRIEARKTERHLTDEIIAVKMSWCYHYERNSHSP